MIINKDNGKKLFELNENELIIYRFLRNKIIKRTDIRSAYLNEESLIILTYDNKVVTEAIIKMAWKDRDGFKILVDEINNENVIFGTNFNNGYSQWFMPLYLVLFLGPPVNSDLIFVINSLILILLMIIAGITSKNYRGNIYYIDTKKFEVIGFKNRIKRRFTTSDIELVKSDEVGTKYKVKDSKYKFYIRNVITYPVLYKRAIAEMKMKAE